MTLSVCFYYPYLSPGSVDLGQDTGIFIDFGTITRIVNEDPDTGSLLNITHNNSAFIEHAGLIWCNFVGSDLTPLVKTLFYLTIYYGTMIASSVVTLSTQE